MEDFIKFIDALRGVTYYESFESYRDGNVGYRPVEVDLVEEFIQENPEVDADNLIEGGIDHLAYGLRIGKIYTFRGKGIALEASVGGMDQGSLLFHVFKYGDKFFKAEGHYSSWDGTYWEDYDTFEVVPKPVTIYEWVQAD